MHRVGFEPKIPVFESSKTIRVFHSVGTGTGLNSVFYISDGRT